MDDESKSTKNLKRIDFFFRDNYNMLLIILSYL